MHGSVQHKICELLSKNKGTTFNPQKMDESKIIYKSLFELFKEKNLITEYTTETGTSYPKIIGYNFYNDPEIYIAYRKIGEENWNGRISNSNLVEKEIIKLINKKYEIREKTLIKKY